MESMAQLSNRRKPIALALQGGGALGAYGWGALDALLGSRSVSLERFSGTSAGAINAALVASALARGTPRHARDALASFWNAIAASPLDNMVGLLWGSIGRSLKQSFGDWLTSSVVSPYSGNPMGYNPLRSLLTKHVDIDALRDPAAPSVYVTLTNVHTGLPRVLANTDLSIEALLASACLPQFFQAIKIGGEYFWDGGYCGNPTLWPLIRSPGVDDVVLVQLAQNTAREVPVNPRDIQRRVGEIVFNSSLVAEMQAIHTIRSLSEASEQHNSFTRVRLHRIGPPPAKLIQSDSAGNRSARFLNELAEAGRAGARGFLRNHGAQIGIAGTLDIKGSFIDPRKPRVRGPARVRRTTRVDQAAFELVG
jgi:NTE family protein